MYIDKYLSSIKNSENNKTENEENSLQMRLYNNLGKGTEIDLSDEEKNELITKKEELPSDIKIEKGLSRQENLIRLRKRLILEEIEEGKENIQKSKIGVSLFILLVGLFSLWIPLYKTICESQGFAVKTGHQDYSFQNRKCK